MRKIISLLIVSLFVLCGVSHANVKVQYDPSTGVVICGHNSTNQNIPTPNIEVTDQAWRDAQAPFMVPSVDLETLTLKVTEVHDYVNEFNTQKFLVDCQASFTMTEQIQAMPYQRSFESLLDSNPPAHDFGTFKSVVMGLIGAGILTESHYSKMVAACALQNIDLSTYEVV